MKFQRTFFRDLQILLLICLVPALMLGNEPGEVISSGIRNGFAVHVPIQFGFGASKSLSENASILFFEGLSVKFGTTNRIVLI